VWVGKLNVQLVMRRRLASKEKVTQLEKLLADDARRVRMAAAAALAEDASPAAAEAALARLALEPDAGVLSSLLELAASPEHHAALPESLLVQLMERLWAGRSFEDVEPLIAVARVARGRTSSGMRSLVERLTGHPHPAVRDAALGVLPGDRAPGARARPIVVTDLNALPLYALLRTSRGDVRVAFLREQAPATVQNFVALARAGTLDGTPFHRVIADFVAQGGDPRGDGSGGPGYTIACERTDERFTRGAVGMAHAGQDTAGSQFFLTHSDQPHLDGRYTLFARVVGGMDVMDALQPDDVLHRIEITFAAPPR
jgi:cyclophilin family peptidyl-prolyl cis-trans isomerase